MRKGGPPRIVTLRGSAHGSNLEALPQQGYIFPNASRICPQPAKKNVQMLPDFCPNLAQTLPKSSPNPPKTLPNSTQKAFWSPSWSHAWKKLYFERPKYEQKSPKSGPKRPQTVPTPSQMRPKTLQIRFLAEFLACYLQLYNFFDFCSNFSWISYVFVRADLQNSCAHAVFCWLFSKIAILEKMRKIIENSSPNPSKTLPKSFQNRWKFEKNWFKKPWWLK